MCIVSAKAELTKTKILSMPLDNGRHLISYKNKAENKSGKVNSMILPIPGKLSKDWFYDTTEYNDFMDEIERRTKVNLTRSLGIERGFKSKSIEEFSLGIYKVISTNDIDALIDRLGVYGPDISDELLDFFKNHYKGWNFVCCIFDGDKKMDSQPIMFEYEPFDSDWVYFPTMDSHTGGAPDLNESVKLDHTLMTEHSGLEGDTIKEVHFKQEVPEVLRRRKYAAFNPKGSLQNGDMYLKISDLASKGKFRGEFFEKLKRTPVHPGELETIS